MSFLDRRLSRGQLLVIPVAVALVACSPPLNYAEHTINSRRDEPTGFKDITPTPLTLRRDADVEKLWQLNDAVVDNPDFPCL